MKDATELLMRIIAQETKHIESMRHTLKEDELTILRLQNKARVLDIEIEERKKLVEEYRSYLRDISEDARTKLQLKNLVQSQIDTKLSETKLELIKN